MTDQVSPFAPLKGVVIAELGERLAASICGTLLAQLGAKVVLVEIEPSIAQPRQKWRHPELTAFNKELVRVNCNNTSERDLLVKQLNACDVVITSSDVDPSRVQSVLDGITSSVIKCDITAFGSSGPLTGEPYSEIELQALTGIIHTTGSPECSPAVTKIPIVEITSGIWSAIGIVASLYGKKTRGVSQNVEIALFDCAFSTLATFLPKYFAGQESERIGNRHPSIAPWNCYAARDGWVQICTGSSDQWARLATVIGYDHVNDPLNFATMPERLRRSDELDTTVECWTKNRPIREVIKVLSAVGIPCGPVSKIGDLLSDPNLRHRNMVLDIHSSQADKQVAIPGNIFGNSMAYAGQANDAPVFSARSLRKNVESQKPLAGLNVVEIGQWTTAPLAARILAVLGANVTKVEPPGGDPARVSAPMVNGQSYLFNLNNSEKQFIELNMRSPEGKRSFEQLLKTSDVLVENLKPGSLAKLGYSFDTLRQIKPEIIYCAVSGFGANSLYAGRPAMDTVLQAECGVMDLTRSEDVPYKIGISVADLMGGHFGALGILAALYKNSKEGRSAKFIDLSMQDITAWATQFSWNSLDQSLNQFEVLSSEGRYYLANKLDPRKLPLPVLSVKEVARHEQTRTRELIVQSEMLDNCQWPLLTIPIRLDKSPLRVTRLPVKTDLSITVEA